MAIKKNLDVLTKKAYINDLSVESIIHQMNKKIGHARPNIPIVLLLPGFLALTFLILPVSLVVLDCAQWSLECRLLCFFFW